MSHAGAGDRVQIELHGAGHGFSLVGVVDRRGKAALEYSGQGTYRISTRGKPPETESVSATTAKPAASKSVRVPT